MTRKPHGIDGEALLGDILANWRDLEPHIPDLKLKRQESAQAYIDWAADRALELYDQGEGRRARMLFSYLINEHPETVGILHEGEALGDLIASVTNGRDAFEAHMRGLLKQS